MSQISDILTVLLPSGWAGGGGMGELAALFTISLALSIISRISSSEYLKCVPGVTTSSSHRYRRLHTYHTRKPL